MDFQEVIVTFRMPPIFDDYVLVETLEQYVSKVELENQMIGVLRTDSEHGFNLTGYIEVDSLNTIFSDYIERESLGLIAFSGNFSDLEGTENVILVDQFLTDLSDYVPVERFSELSNKLASLNTELADLIETEVTSLITEISEDIDSNLEDYDLSSSVDVKISDALLDLESNEMPTLIESEFNLYLTNEEFDLVIPAYIKENNINDYIADVTGGLVFDSSFDDEILNYVTFEELYSFEYLAQGLEIEMVANSVVFLDNVSVSGDVVSDVNMSLGKLGVGVSDPSSLVHLHNQDGNEILMGISLDSQSDDTSNSEDEGIKIGVNIEGYAEFHMQKSKPIIFNANGSEALRVSESGNVGVGISSPNYKLDIAGDINFTGELYINGEEFEGGVFLDSGEATDQNQPVSYSGGYIGIGTDSPSAELSVSGSVKATALKGMHH